MYIRPSLNLLTLVLGIFSVISFDCSCADMLKARICSRQGDPWGIVLQGVHVTHDTPFPRRDVLGIHPQKQVRLRGCRLLNFHAVKCLRLTLGQPAIKRLYLFGYMLRRPALSAKYQLLGCVLLPE